jgi:hypothetical protein
MKRRILISVVACAIVAGAAFVRPLTPPVQAIHFAGFTNGVVGPIAPIFGSLTASNGASIRRWLAAGTNGALFTISNQQTCSICLFPLGRMCTGEPKPTRDETPLLNAPDFSGIRLAPGQIATVQVAVLPDRAAWRLQLYYSRDSCSDSFLNNLRLLPQSLLALATRSAVHVQTHTIESDLIRDRVAAASNGDPAK